MEQTLAMVKPDGIQRGLTEECIKRILKEGLTIRETKTFTMSKELAEGFRAEIKEKHPTIWNSLIEYMTEGAMVALIVEGVSSVERVRKLYGATNPKEALKGTIRGDFGEGDMKELYKQGKVIKNIIHASGNIQEAAEELKLIFEHDAMKQPEGDTKGGRT